MRNRVSLADDTRRVFQAQIAFVDTFADLVLILVFEVGEVEANEVLVCHHVICHVITVE